MWAIWVFIKNWAITTCTILTTRTTLISIIDYIILFTLRYTWTIPIKKKIRITSCTIKLRVICTHIACLMATLALLLLILEIV